MTDTAKKWHEWRSPADSPFDPESKKARAWAQGWNEATHAYNMELIANTKEQYRLMGMTAP
jgi:hypothetical protein